MRHYAGVTFLAGLQSPSRTPPTDPDIPPVILLLPQFEAEMSMPRYQYGRPLVFPARAVENVSIHK